MRGRHRDERGQSSVELMGALPLLILAFLAVLQLAFACVTVQATGTAARAAARAASLGDSPGAAAHAAVPGWVGETLNVRQHRDDRTAYVEVSSHIPLVLPGLHGRVGEVRRRASFPLRAGVTPWG